MNHLLVLTQGPGSRRRDSVGFSTTPEIDALREQGRPSTPAEWQARRKGTSPGVSVGSVVKVYARTYEGRPGQPYFLARVFSVAPDRIRVVAAHREETLTQAEWDARVRGHDAVWDSLLAIVPYGVSHPDPPPLPPGVHADTRVRWVGLPGVVKYVGTAAIPVAVGAVVGHLNPGVGAGRGALTGLGAGVGLAGGRMAGSEIGAAFGAAAGGAAAWKLTGGGDAPWWVAR